MARWSSYTSCGRRRRSPGTIAPELLLRLRQVLREPLEHRRQNDVQVLLRREAVAGTLDGYQFAGDLLLLEGLEYLLAVLDGNQLVLVAVDQQGGCRLVRHL